MNVPTLLLSTFVLGTMITNLTSKYLLVEIDGSSNSMKAGDPQSYPGIDRSPPIRPPRDWIQSLSDEEKQTIGDIAERFHGEDGAGCFHGSNKVYLENGQEKQISGVKVGDSVLAVDEQGLLRFSPVIMQIHESPEEESVFRVIRTKTGRNLTLTPHHLMYKKSNDEANKNSGGFGTFFPVFAADVSKGDYVLVLDGKSGMKKDEVVSTDMVSLNGVYSPLTDHGNIVVEDILASCYSVYESHSIQHLAFAPFRWFYDAKRNLQNMQISMKLGQSAEELGDFGRHWYGDALIAIANNMALEKIA